MKTGKVSPVRSAASRARTVRRPFKVMNCSTMAVAFGGMSSLGGEENVERGKLSEGGEDGAINREKDMAGQGKHDKCDHAYELPERVPTKCIRSVARPPLVKEASKRH
jgi:hypothetical protein